MITLKNVSKYYYSKGIIASGFTKLNLNLSLGEFVAITGESGSGKSTLLNFISGLDSYEEGEMYIDGQETSHYTDDDFLKYRRKYISNIFQNFNLVNSYTVYQNIELVFLLNGENKREIKTKVYHLIEKVGLVKYKNTKVSKLSGGQKQRVAIARALAKDTPIIIADEPTGSLDKKSAQEVIEILHDISQEKLVIIVTHNYEQVEKYVTRKIKMHDGKIIEDNRLVQTKRVESYLGSKRKSLTLGSKLKLGFRNTFNIIPKFLLVFFVYLFIILAVTSEYAFFTKQSYDDEVNGYNYFFQDISPTRIVLTKKDRTSFTDDDYQSLKNTAHIQSVVKNDLLLDTPLIVHNNSYYYDGYFQIIDNLEGKIDIGRKAIEKNEIVIECSRDDYFFNKDAVDTEMELQDNNGNEFSGKYKIVGIKFSKNVKLYHSINIYGTTSLEDEVRDKINQSYSNLKVLFEDVYHTSTTYDKNYQVIPNDKVPVGNAIISSDLNYTCEKENCVGRSLEIELENIYYRDTLSLKVLHTYNKKTMDSLLGIKEFDDYNGAIFINPTDYNNLYNKGNYQSSIFVSDDKYLDEVATILQENYKTLKIKDTLPDSGVREMMRILRTIITIGLVITLFFISYFVIRIIMKSRSIYFGTIRILGATKRQAKQLLTIELLTISNLAFLVFLIALYLQINKVINLNIFMIMIKYLKLFDYFILYFVITMMSYLISLRFAKKIFKNSAMSSMREG